MRVTLSMSFNEKTPLTCRATKSGGKNQVDAHGYHEQAENAEIDVLAERRIPPSLVPRPMKNGVTERPGVSDR
jgi:hypothetical protein